MLQARFPVVLASASPRRRELISRLLPDFEVIEPSVDEEALRQADPWSTARDSARSKAEAIAALRPQAMVIGGDTVVAFQSGGSWQQLAKPSDAHDAIGMLEELSGKRHAVISAVAVYSPSKSIQFEDTSWVTFREISRSEIESYVASGEPMDKAGAYAIQGGASGFVSSVEGEVSTVIGLPVERLQEALLSSGLASICAT